MLDLLGRILKIIIQHNLFNKLRCDVMMGFFQLPSPTPCGDMQNYTT